MCLLVVTNVLWVPKLLLLLLVLVLGVVMLLLLRLLLLLNHLVRVVGVMVCVRVGVHVAWACCSCSHGLHARH